MVSSMQLGKNGISLEYQGNDGPTDGQKDGGTQSLKQSLTRVEEIGKKEKKMNEDE